VSLTKPDQAVSSPVAGIAADPFSGPDAHGHFGRYGGIFVGETLIAAVEELDQVYTTMAKDPKFWAEIDRDLKYYVGRPSPLYVAERLTAHFGGARIVLKREDLNHTGAHKINNTIGQALLAKFMGKPRIIAETGAGQHGVASATIAARLGLQCDVYMGAEDIKRQSANVFRMKLMGANVIPVESGSRTLKDALNEALRDWAANVDNTYYIIGTAAGPHPYPRMVRDFQSVIGREARQQSLETGRHAAPLSAGRPGILHGNRTYLMTDDAGQIMETHSVSAGLDYPGVGPEHSWLKDIGRVSYVAATDTEALEAFRRLSRMEGIIPALETSHAIAHAGKLAAGMSKDKIIVVNLSGRGDKDIHTVASIDGINI